MTLLASFVGDMHGCDTAIHVAFDSYLSELLVPISELVSGASFMKRPLIKKV